MPYITTGERIGYDRGKVEGQKEEAIAISLNMLKGNLPLETIARFTGLSIAQLQQLQTESQ
jgi:predicted transposase YdaD